MSASVRHTVTDLSRAIARLDKYGNGDPGTPVDIYGTNWTVEDMRISVANDLAYVIGATVRLRKVARRDVALMLAAHGADGMTIDKHAGAIAAMLRADFANSRMSATI